MQQMSIVPSIVLVMDPYPTVFSIIYRKRQDKMIPQNAWKTAIEKRKRPKRSAFDARTALESEN